MKEDWTERKEDEEYIAKMKQALSPEEFRREYLNEPSMLPRDLDGLRPSCVIIDDMGEQWQPAKRPHRLHNHPRMEVELGLNEREVIIDQEFVHLFKSVRPVRGRRHEVGVDHFIVSKKEFLERMEESRGGGNRK